MSDYSYHVILTVSEEEMLEYVTQCMMETFSVKPAVLYSSDFYHLPKENESKIAPDVTK